VHGYYQSAAHTAPLPPEPRHDFGRPLQFETQRARLKASVRRKVAATLREMKRLLRERLARKQ